MDFGRLLAWVMLIVAIGFGLFAVFVQYLEPNVETDAPQSSSVKSSSAAAETDVSAVRAAIDEALASGSFLGLSVLFEALPVNEETEQLRQSAVDGIRKKLRGVPAENVIYNFDLYSELVRLDPSDERAIKRKAYYNGLTTDFLWDVSRHRSELDDSQTITASLRASAGSADGGRASAPVLYVRCRSNKTEVYIDWHSFLGWEDSSSFDRHVKRVTYRLDSAPQETSYWYNSTDDQALFVHYAIELARDLSKASKFIIQITPYGEDPVLTRFETSGSWAAIKEVADGCNWKLPVPPAP